VGKWVFGFGLRFDMWLKYRATKLLNFSSFATFGNYFLNYFS